MQGGGEMGALIRARDWAETPLGPPEGWPQTLKTSVRLILSSGHPMFIRWGPQLIQFYNEAYRVVYQPIKNEEGLVTAIFAEGFDVTARA